LMKLLLSGRWKAEVETGWSGESLGSFQQSSSRSDRSGCQGGGDQRPATYVFLHLHKTAGNNLKTHLFGFAKRNNLSLYHSCRVSNGEAELASAWYRRRKRKDVDYDCNLHELAAMPEQRRNEFDWIVGHQHFGVHTLISSRETRYITFLRRPLERKISHFSHFEDLGANGSVFQTRHALEVYLLTQNKNYMTKRLAGTGYTTEFYTDMISFLIDSDPTYHEMALASARRNLIENFFFVGLLERFNESLCILAHLLNTACYNGLPITHMPFKPERVAASHKNERLFSSRWARSVDSILRRRVSLYAEDLDEQVYVAAEILFRRQLADHPQCVMRASHSP